MENEMAEKNRGKSDTGAHTQISIRLPNELLKHIETFAKADRRKRNNAIEHLLWQAIKESR
jgi:metal-responsive CopG/Arc/MetJ family transcriptional regulator